MDYAEKFTEGHESKIKKKTELKLKKKNFEDGKFSGCG
jgi:hypothetical protein